MNAHSASRPPRTNRSRVWQTCTTTIAWALVFGCGDSPDRGNTTVGGPAQASTPQWSAAPSEVKATAPAPHPVWPLKDGWAVVGPADPSAARGEPELVVGEADVLGVSRAVDPAKLKPAEALLVGAEVVTFDQGGGTCPAKVVALSHAARSFHTFDTTSVAAHFKATPPPARSQDPLLRDAVKRTLAESGGVLELVAQLEPRAKCELTGGWAAPAGTPRPALVELVAAAEPLARLAADQLRALPVFAAIDVHYGKNKKVGEPPHWWELSEYGQAFTVATVADSRRILHANASVCRGYTDFTMNLDVFFEVTGADATARLRALEPARPSEARWPQAIGDLDHDGALDIVTLDGFILASGRGLGEQRFTRGAIYTCPGDSAAASAFLATQAR